jgi:hypothetical protein
VTNSALTRWLKQGLTRGMCPLCRVAHKADREYLWHFFEEYSTTETVSMVATTRPVASTLIDPALARGSWVEARSAAE